MTLRVFFTGADLARTRVAAGPLAMWELVLSLHQLRSRHVDSDLADWQAATRQALRAAGRLPRPLARLVPPLGYFPDFMTPDSTDVDDGVETVLSTPRKRRRADLEALTKLATLPPWAIDIADGRDGELDMLGDTLRQYHRMAIAPRWTEVGRQVEADRGLRARTVLDGGTEAMLAGFQPFMRWDGDALVAPYPVDRDLHLDGRGVLLVPSYFCRRTPLALVDPSLPPVLVYPARQPEVSRPAAPGRVVALLGRTRAGVLHAVSAPSTTGEIARRLLVSAATASEHMTVLRDAGLVTSQRYANSVLHALTPLGAALLDGG